MSTYAPTTPRSPATEQPGEPPRPTAHFRRRAWREFQRALDPLAPPKPLRSPHG